MSKFVTYPAVTVLDNDHSLLIDDPNAGTNSITAENAGNTLLSKWAGFETFDEAVQNTIEHNQAFIDRDTAIRSEIAELKKKIVTTFPAKDASGAVATFESEFEDAPLKSCIVRVEPVQEGSGDPSPDNVRPISGWTGCEVQRTGVNIFDGEMENGDINSKTGENSGTSTSRYRSKNYIPIRSGSYYFKSPNRTGTVRVFLYDKDKNFLEFAAWSVNEVHAVINERIRYARFRFSTGKVDGDEQISINSPSSITDYVPYVGHTYPITFPTEAGTVYGGYIDPINGELVVDRVEVADLGTLSWSYGTTSNPPRFFAQLPYTGKNDPWWVTDAMLSTGEYTLGTNVGQDGVDKKYGISTKIIYFTNAEYTNADDFKASITGTQVVYRIATPIHYHLTPIEITSLLGQNNIWSDAGNTSVEYLMSDVSWYVKKKLKAFQSILAGVEDSTSASKNYSANTYLIFNDDIYKTTKAITAGETIEEGVTVTKTTVAEQLMALAQA